MSSIVSICNQALSHVGARASIASLSEDSEEARHCRVHVDAVRDEVLRGHRWSFAARRVVLAELGDAPAGWAHRYALPADCLLAREIERTHRACPPIRYRLESDADAGRVLLTDQPAAVLLYTARVTDPSLFDPLFVTALTWALAARIALPLGASESIQRRAVQMAGYALAQAQTMDASEDGVMVVDHEPEWITARGAGAGWGGEPWRR